MTFVIGAELPAKPAEATRDNASELQGRSSQECFLARMLLSFVGFCGLQRIVWYVEFHETFLGRPGRFLSEPDSSGFKTH